MTAASTVGARIRAVPPFHQMKRRFISYFDNRIFNLKVGMVFKNSTTHIRVTIEYGMTKISKNAK
jgi:hypothetical protein